MSEAVELSARAKAAGVPVGRFLRGDFDARASLFAADLARAVAADRRAANRELTDLRREHRAELEDRDRQHTASLESADERVRVAVEEALANEDTPAGRAASHRQAAVTAALERYQLNEVERLERMSLEENNRKMCQIRRDQLRLEAESYGFTAEQDKVLRLALKVGRESIRKALAPRIDGAEKRAQAAEAKADSLQREVTRLGTVQEQLVKTQDELAAVRRDAAQVPVLRAQVKELTEQRRVAQRSPLLQFPKDQEAWMRDLTMQGEHRQRQWDAEQAEREQRRVAERGELEQQQREQVIAQNNLVLARWGKVLVIPEQVERG